MAELKKLPCSSWARTGTVWREKHLKLWHEAEPTTPHPERPPSPCAAGALGPSPGIQLPCRGLWGSDWIPGTTCSTCPLGKPWGWGHHRGSPRPAAVSQRGGHAQQGLIALQSLLTRAAGNEHVHFYLTEIPEDLQTAENVSPGKRDGQQPSGHRAGPWGHPRQGCWPACSPWPLTFFRILMETVSTKLTGLKSRMMAWKPGWGSPRVRRVGLGGALSSAPLSSITATPGPLTLSSACWGREGVLASLHGGWRHPRRRWPGSVPPPKLALPYSTGGPGKALWLH